MNTLEQNKGNTVKTQQTAFYCALLWPNKQLKVFMHVHAAFVK